MNTIFDDREKMPVFDESIFDLEGTCKKYGLTLEDFQEIVEYFKWHLEQQRTRKLKEQLIQILKTRQKQLVEEKRQALIKELKGLEKF